jgi:hypothetical protein
MAGRSGHTFSKRQREQKKARKKKEKAERRAQKKREQEQQAEGAEPAVDPDIAHIEPGPNQPQPWMEWGEDKSGVEEELADLEDDEQPQG